VQISIERALQIETELHKEAFTDLEAEQLQFMIRRWLADCKEVYASQYKDDEGFGFLKFHTGCAHMEWLIKEFGAFHTTCTGRMETEHQVAAKDPYKRTSRRNKTYRAEMTRRLQKQHVFAAAQAALAAETALVAAIDPHVQRASKPWVATRDSWCACSATADSADGSWIPQDMFTAVRYYAHSKPAYCFDGYESDDCVFIAAVRA
jgi:hypothetical protein